MYNNIEDENVFTRNPTVYIKRNVDFFLCCQFAMPAQFMVKFVYLTIYIIILPGLV